MGIPVRIALNKDILSLEVENRLKDLQKKTYFIHEAENYPHMFKSCLLKGKQKLSLAEKRMGKI